MDTISRLLLAALANLIWQAALIYVAACAAAWLVRRSPARQHVVWMAAFGLCLLAPLATAWRHPRGPAARLAPRLEAPLSQDSTAGKVTLGLYLLTVIWFSGRHLRSWRRAGKVLASASPGPFPESVKEAAALSEARFGLPALRLLCSPEPITPLTARGAVVLPESLLRPAEHDMLLAAVGHEAAHIARQDFRWNALLELLYPLLAFHPCAGLIRRNARDSRELACDDLVAGSLLDSSRYAASLLEVALRTAPAEVPAASVGSTSGNLEERIQRLVLRPAEGPPSGLATAAACALLAIVATAGWAFGFQASNPRDYTGVFQENWGRNFRSDIAIDLTQCCFRVMEIRYAGGVFSGAVTVQWAGVENNRVVPGGRRSVPIRDAALENGVLRFRRIDTGNEELFEVTLGERGEAMVRSNHVQRVNRDWVTFKRVR